MAIQFSCSNCQNPIEVDEEFAEQMATCPYCRAVLKVPLATTLESQQPIAARPIDPQVTPSPAHLGYPQDDQPTIGGVVDPEQVASARRWGYGSLALSMITLVLGIFYMFSLAVQAAQAVPDLNSSNQFDPNMQIKAQQAMAQAARTQTMVVASVGTLVFALAGIAAALLGLRLKATWPAVTGLILSLLSFSCLSCFSSSLYFQGELNAQTNPPMQTEPTPDAEEDTPDESDTRSLETTETV